MIKTLLMSHPWYNLEACHTQIPLDSVPVPCFPLPKLIFFLATGNSCPSTEAPSESSSILAIAETRFFSLQARLSVHADGKIYLLLSPLKGHQHKDLCTAPSPTKNMTLMKPSSNLSCGRSIRGALSPGDWPCAEALRRQMEISCCEAHRNYTVCIIQIPQESGALKYRR